MLHPGAAVTLIPQPGSIVQLAINRCCLSPSLVLAWHAIFSRLFSVAYANRSENGDHAVMHTSRYARWIRSTACLLRNARWPLPNLTNNTTTVYRIRLGWLWCLCIASLAN